MSTVLQALFKELDTYLVNDGMKTSVLVELAFGGGAG